MSALKLAGNALIFVVVMILAIGSATIEWGSELWQELRERS